jgi:S-adenosylmethionine hydrolase
MNSSARSSLITLTSDFGLQDPFVGQMKGVILKLNPSANVVDLTHGIPRHDVKRAAQVVAESRKYFPKGTVHVAVVDPGVGSERRSLVVEAGGNLFVGPDNGIFTGILREHPDNRIVSISHDRFQLGGSHGTFHGRDLYAPVAAILGLGERIDDMGEFIDGPVLLDLPSAIVKKGSVMGEVVHIDVFGNAVTNIKADEIEKLGNIENLTVEVKGSSLDMLTHYAAATDGSPHALINSDGCLEIFINQGNASGHLSLVPGTEVTVKSK